MEFNKVNQERHSIRDFSSRQVSTKQLQTIVKAAQQAPSWVNSQPNHGKFTLQLVIL